jgi:TolA-binding protein
VIRQLFERKASYEATVLAEAQSLRDDGLDLEFVLGLFPEEAEWLEPLLTTATDLDAAFEGDPPSYYFEASLKAKFIGAATEPKPVVPVVVSPPSFSPFRTAIATGSVASAAAAVGILALGFVTAGDSTPGDWNYTFKFANERFQYSTSRGDSRIDVQIRTVQARIEELNKAGANANESQFAAVRREYDELARSIAKQEEIDSVRYAQIVGISGTAAAVVNDVVAKQPALAEQGAAANDSINNTVQAAGAAAAVGLPSPTPTATATATQSPTAEPTAEVTPSPSVSPDPTHAATPETTPTPEETGTPEATATGTEQPVASDTETPSATAAP